MKFGRRALTIALCIAGALWLASAVIVIVLFGWGEPGDVEWFRNTGDGWR